MMTNNIIVSRGLTNDYMALYRALSDKALRESLKQQSDLDRAFKDLLLMADDPEYVKMVNDVKAVAIERYCGAVVPEEVDKLREYASAKYPEGWSLIREYEMTTRNSLIPTGIPVDVVVQVGPYVNFVAFVSMIPVVLSLVPGFLVTCF